MHYKQVKNILSAQNGMNLYRGCTHGCIYCDSRSCCYQMHHKFEDVEVKANAIELLENALRNKRKKCMIGTGSMSDPYLHIEEELQLTRKSLELINRYGFGVAIQTKSNRILRDLDLLREINQKAKCVVQITLTTADESICKIIEPNVSTTKERVEVLKIMNENGIPTIVWLTPILPFINDTEENINMLLDACFETNVKGIISFGMGVTLREGDRDYFYENLDRYFPGLKDKYIATYGNSYEVTSMHNDHLMEIFFKRCKEQNVMSNTDQIFHYLHEYETKDTYEQFSLPFL